MPILTHEPPMAKDFTVLHKVVMTNAPFLPVAFSPRSSTRSLPRSLPFSYINVGHHFKVNADSVVRILIVGSVVRFRFEASLQGLISICMRIVYPVNVRYDSL